MKSQCPFPDQVPQRVLQPSRPLRKGPEVQAADRAVAAQFAACIYAAAPGAGEEEAGAVGPHVARGGDREGSI